MLFVTRYFTDLWPEGPLIVTYQWLAVYTCTTQIFLIKMDVTRFSVYWVCLSWLYKCLYSIHNDPCILLPIGESVRLELVEDTIASSFLSVISPITRVNFSLKQARGGYIWWDSSSITYEAESSYNISIPHVDCSSTSLRGQIRMCHVC